VLLKFSCFLVRKKCLHTLPFELFRSQLLVLSLCSTNAYGNRCIKIVPLKPSLGHVFNLAHPLNLEMFTFLARRYAHRGLLTDQGTPNFFLMSIHATLCYHIKRHCPTIHQLQQNCLEKPEANAQHHLHPPNPPATHPFSLLSPSPPLHRSLHMMPLTIPTPMLPIPGARTPPINHHALMPMLRQRL
jgi:hypothetical protein